MTSNDVITVELFNSKMETMMAQIQLGNERIRNELSAKIDGVENRLNARMDKLETRIEVLDARLTGIESRMDDLKTFMSIGFSIVAIIVALMALAPAIANFFQRLLKPSITLEEVRELMHEEVGTAVSKALGQSGR